MKAKSTTSGLYHNWTLIDQHQPPGLVKVEHTCDVTDVTALLNSESPCSNYDTLKCCKTQPQLLALLCDAPQMLPDLETHMPAESLQKAMQFIHCNTQLDNLSDIVQFSQMVHIAHTMKYKASAWMEHQFKSSLLKMSIVQLGDVLVDLITVCRVDYGNHPCIKVIGNALAYRSLQEKTLFTTRYLKPIGLHNLDTLMNIIPYLFNEPLSCVLADASNLTSRQTLMSQIISAQFVNSHSRNFTLTFRGNIQYRVHDWIIVARWPWFFNLMRSGLTEAKEAHLDLGQYFRKQVGDILIRIIYGVSPNLRTDLRSRQDAHEILLYGPELGMTNVALFTPLINHCANLWYPDMCNDFNSLVHAFNAADKKGYDASVFACSSGLLLPTLWVYNEPTLDLIEALSSPYREMLKPIALKVSVIDGVNFDLEDTIAKWQQFKTRVFGNDE